MSQTIVEIFKKTVAKYPNQPALHYKEAGQWRTQTWREYWHEVMTLARGMIKLGMKARDAVAIISGNCRQWVISDLAAICGGGVPAGIYPSSSPEQCSFIIEHCRASLVVVENLEQLKKVQPLLESLPFLRAIILISGTSPHPDVYSWQDVLTLGEQASSLPLEERINALKPSDLATLVYTSGTTANPKGVMLTHTNLTWAAGALIEQNLHLTNHDVMLSYLPLSHIAEQIITIHAALFTGYHIYFVESLERLAANLKEVRPTVFFGVPRVWEKIQSAMMEKAAANKSSLKKKLVAWAKSVGLAHYQPKASRGIVHQLQYAVAKKLVFSKVREALGLDRCRLHVTAAAPISSATLDYFSSLDVPLYEVYGLSESSGPATISTPDSFKPGSVGKTIAGTMLTIADDGEILIRGPHVCLGYLHNAAETAEMIDSAGFLHTGDLGFVDQDGFVTINGRKKNLIITAGGENISTEMIEGTFKSLPGVEHVVAVGDREKYLTLLLTLDPQALTTLSQTTGARGTTLADLARSPELYAFFKREIERINQSIAHVQTIKKFKILPTTFAEDTGELTPTMKVKRNIVLKKYSQEIAELYA